MKKTSKILSLLVALCMAVTMFSGLTVMAEGELELVSFDADADFITLDFNKAIDTANSTIVLKKGDDYIPFTIAKPLFHSNVQTKTSSRYTYTLTPDGGVDVGEEYKISFWDVKASETDVLAQTAYTFVVEELATTTNFQNVDGYKWAEAQDWNWDKAEDGSKFYLDELPCPTKNNMEGFAQLGAKIGNDDTEEHVLPSRTNTTGSANWTESEYTFKATFKSDERLGRPQIYFGIARNISGYNATSANATDITGFNFGGYTNQAATAQTPNLYFINGGHNSGSAVKNLAGNNRVSTKIDMTAGVALKVSSKDGVVRMFINNKKAADFAATVAPGFPVIAFRPVGAYNSATACDVEIYDMQVTQSLFLVEDTLDYPEGLEPEPDPEPDPEEPTEPEEEEYPDMILDWDADLDFFTVDFEEEIASLDATITQAGTIIPATAYVTGNEKSNQARCTWIVKPEAGFIRDIPYTVTLSNVKNAAGTKKISTWDKTFKVEVLAEGLDLEEGTTTAMYKSTSNAVFTNPEGTKDIVINANGYEGSTDTSRLYIYKSLGTTENGDPVYESDYTVKVTYKNLVNAKYIQTGVGYTTTSSTSYGWDHNSMKGIMAFCGGNSADNRAQAAIYQNHIGSGNGANTNVFAANSVSGKIFSYINLKTDGEAEVKLAVKNGHAHSYLNGVKTVDTALLGAAAGVGRPMIIANIRSITADTTASLTVANFIATRAVVADVLGESFTVAEPEMSGAFADATVSISAVVTNNTTKDNKIFAMCALYDATGAMKNAVIAPVTTAATGETTINFANVDTNGAAYAKVFIWDDALTLNPYFPAITVE